MKVEYITHNEKQVLIVDYTGVKNKKDMLQILDEAADSHIKSEKRVRSISVMNNAYMGQEYINELKRLTPKVFAPKVKKTAVCGLSNLQKVIIGGFNRANNNALKTLETLEEALEYVTS